MTITRTKPTPKPADDALTILLRRLAQSPDHSVGAWAAALAGGEAASGTAPAHADGRGAGLHTKEDT